MFTLKSVLSAASTKKGTTSPYQDVQPVLSCEELKRSQEAADRMTAELIADFFSMLKEEMHQLRQEWPILVFFLLIGTALFVSVIFLANHLASL